MGDDIYYNGQVVDMEEASQVIENNGVVKAVYVDADMEDKPIALNDGGTLVNPATGKVFFHSKLDAMVDDTTIDVVFIVIEEPQPHKYYVVVKNIIEDHYETFAYSEEEAAESALRDCAKLVDRVAIDGEVLGVERA